MKKLLSLSLIILLLILSIPLIGCNGNGSTTTQDVTTTSPDNNAHKLLINGRNIHDYKIIIPSECTNIVKYAASNLALLLKQVTGIALPIDYDSCAESECEILIGDTNRNASSTSSELGDGEYLLHTNGSKIVMKGYEIYVGAACGVFVNEHIGPKLSESSDTDITSLPTSENARKFSWEGYELHNVIFMIGDGMGKQHVKMAERNGLTKFIGNKLPNIGSSKTASLSVINGEIGWTDSAASATAMSTGYKTLNSYLGLDGEGNILKNVRELALENGAKTAIITTDVITGGTPAAYLCHHNDRRDTPTLQSQIDNIISSNKIDYIAGDVGNDLTDKVAEALTSISAGNSQFFIMIEEAQIDKASEEHEYFEVVNYVKRFDDAIAYASQYALCHPDTALIVTADHETGQLTPNISMEAKFEFKTYHHTNLNVGIYALGPGTERYNNTTVENTDLAVFTASAYTDSAFGNVTK